MVVLCMVLFLSACGSKTKEKTSIVSEPIVAGDYKILNSLASSTARQTHVEFNRGWYDREAVGKGIMAYSKSHFSPDTYYMMEGQIFAREDLQPGVVENQKESILGRKSSDNEYGLNPEIGTTFTINDAGETITVGRQTVPIRDLFEINFTKEASDDPKIDGISLAIVLSSAIYDDKDQEREISDTILFKLGEQAAITISDYLHKLPEIGNKVPIYITLFKASSTDDSLPGTFIGESYGKDSISMQPLNEKWVIFSSDEATEMDAIVAQQFDSLKNDLYMLIPNNIGIVGKGKFMDDKLDSLQITITTEAKTYTESSAIIQRTNELVNNFDSNEFEISIRFINDDEAYAMIRRDKGDDETNVIMY